MHDSEKGTALAFEVVRTMVMRQATAVHLVLNRANGEGYKEFRMLGRYLEGALCPAAEIEAIMRSFWDASDAVKEGCFNCSLSQDGVIESDRVLGQGVQEARFSAWPFRGLFMMDIKIISHDMARLPSGAVFQSVRGAR